MLRQYRRIINFSALSRLVSHQPLPHQLRVNYQQPTVQLTAFFQHAGYSTKPSPLKKKTIQLKSSDDYDTKALRGEIASQDSDTFGSLSPNESAADDEFIDEGDIEEENKIKNPIDKRRQLTRDQYANLIKKHLKYKRYKEAIDVLEIQTKQEGHYPNSYLFNLVINACARVGYTKKAFNLFTRMRQRGLLPNAATYTSLFNACANGPYKQQSLEMANRVREIMIEKNIEPNVSNYHVMIKAYGRLGDLKTSFQLVDEMLDKHLPISTATFNFLLQACASDEEFGFRHALLTWHKMYQQNLKPDIYSFNLMLRCCRDTQLGDVETTKEVIQTILLRNSEQKQENVDNITPLLQSNSTENTDNSIVEIVDKKPSDNIDKYSYIPNLLAPRPHLGNLVEIQEIKKPEDRLILLGGFQGFLELMETFEVPPDLKTFSLLIEVIPGTRAAENILLRTIRKQKIKCDVDFFNLLMKKRAVRMDYYGSREVIDQMIRKAALKPDIVTYGVMALSCKSRRDAWELINEMNSQDIKMNMPILGAMIRNACIAKNFEYVKDLLIIVRKFELKPSVQLMETLETFIKICNAEKKKDLKHQPKNFRENVKKFKEFYEKWKTDIGLGKTEKIEDIRDVLEDKPWEQFQEAQAEGYENPKNQVMQMKKKYLHHIKMIKTRDVLIRDEKEAENSH